MSHKNLRFFIILLGFLFFYNTAFAQNTSEISQLKIKIFELEKRFDALEKMIGKSSSNKLQYSEKWRNRALWRKLKTGMSMNEVESLLGVPKKIAGGSVLTTWYYTGRLGNAHVRFDPYFVYGWDEPE